MSCLSCRIPEGAEILARSTGKCRVVYRVGERVVKILKDKATPNYIIAHQAFAAEHDSICEPFDYDYQRHEISQRFLGYDPATPQRMRAIRDYLTVRGLHLDDVIPKNSRGDKLIDFDIQRFAAVPIKPRGVHRRGGLVSINAATEAELRELGALIRWPNAPT